MSMSTLGITSSVPSTSTRCCKQFAALILGALHVIDAVVSFHFDGHRPFTSPDGPPCKSRNGRVDLIRRISESRANTNHFLVIS